MPLKSACEELYQEMLSEVYTSRRLDLSSSSRVTYCFKSCVEHWNKLRELVKSQPFQDQEEEIWFFKQIKPKFTALIEYYAMVHHAELFIPTLKEADVPAFWKKETEKIQQFYHKHAAFYDYYKSGQTYMDSAYFLRSNEEDRNADFNKLYDPDACMATSHSNLATSLLAYDMYEAYITQQSLIA